MGHSLGREAGVKGLQQQHQQSSLSHHQHHHHHQPVQQRQHLNQNRQHQYHHPHREEKHSRQYQQQYHNHHQQHHHHHHSHLHRPTLPLYYSVFFLTMFIVTVGDLFIGSTLGSEFPERECCDNLYPIPAPGPVPRENGMDPALPEYVASTPPATTEPPGKAKTKKHQHEQ